MKDLRAIRLFCNALNKQYSEQYLNKQYSAIKQ